MKEYTQTIKRLRDDNEYFGTFGQQFISNSDIAVLINDPDLYGQPWEQKPDYLKGNYLHHRVLQPELFNNGQCPMTIVDASTRTTKVYKELVEENSIEGEDKPIFLLKKEIVELDYLGAKVNDNDFFKKALSGHRKPNEVEEPIIGELFGYKFKGKADRINRHMGIIADFKTTRSLSSFIWGFKKYGYHSQAYIYSTLFDLPVQFFVIDKETGRLGWWEVSDETLLEGREFVERGLERLEYFYGEKKKGNIEQYFTEGVL